MYRVVLNAEVISGEDSHETWRDLLERLDDRCTAIGRLVTEVRFDGVDEPAFRNEGVLSKPLDGLATIEVESVSPRDLLLATLDDADMAVAPLCEAADRIGSAFRGFDVTAANRDLGELAKSMVALVAITANVADTLGTDLAGVDCSGATGRSMMSALQGFADSLIAAQESEDWVTVADIVEYDLAPNLRRWPILLGVLRTAVEATTA